MTEIKTIFVIDDERVRKQVSKIKEVLPSVTLIPINSTEKIVEQLDAGVIPDAVVTDCFERSSEDVEFGILNAETVIEWHLKNRADTTLPVILFRSNDKGFAVRSKNKIKKSYGDKVTTYNFNDIELKVADRLLKGKSLEIGGYSIEGESTTGFRTFLKDHCNITLPITYEEIQDYEDAHNPDPEDKDLDERNLVKLVERGKFNREEALEILEERATDLAQIIFFPEIEKGQRDDWDDVRDLSIRFNQASGHSKIGYAAFSNADVDALKEEGKTAVLLINEYTQSFIPYLNKLSGLALIDDKLSGHMKILLEAFGVAGALGADDLREDLPFLRDKNGKRIKYAKTIEGQGRQKTFKDFEKVVRELGLEHINKHRSDGNKTCDVNELPILEIDTQKLETIEKYENGERKLLPVTTVKFGDPVTLEIERLLNKARLWPLHLNIKEPDPYNGIHKWVISVARWIDEWHEDNGKEQLKFKANIESPEKAFGLKTGIGLARTEHFILSDEEQFAAYKDYVLNQNKDALSIIQAGTEKNMSTLFSYADYRHPVRIRLMDLPPGEGFSESERTKISELYGERNIRGIQLAEQIPALYEAQIRGIFEETKEHNSRKIYTSLGEVLPADPIVPEIMIPTVRNADEVRMAKAMVTKIAEEYGFGEGDYRFGAMVETVDACNNIEEISRECDFLSIGSNDLTSEIMQCARDDYAKRNKIRKEFGMDKDPFFTLYDPVTEVIYDMVNRARIATDNKIQIDLCGSHAEDLESLEQLRSLKLNGISVSPNDYNLKALKMLYGYQTFNLHGKNDNNPDASCKAEPENRYG